MVLVSTISISINFFFIITSIAFAIYGLGLVEQNILIINTSLSSPPIIKLMNNDGPLQGNRNQTTTKIENPHYGEKYRGLKNPNP